MRKKTNTVPVRVDPALRDFLKDISGSRFKSGKDKWPKSVPRLSLALTRVPNLKKILEEAKIDD